MAHFQTAPQFKGQLQWAYRFFDSSKGHTARSIPISIKHYFHSVTEEGMIRSKKRIEAARKIETKGEETCTWKRSVEQVMTDLNWDDFADIDGEDGRNALVVLSPLPTSEDLLGNFLDDRSSSNRMGCIKAFSFFPRFENKRVSLFWVDMNFECGPSRVNVFNWIDQALKVHCGGAVLRSLEVCIQTELPPFYVCWMIPSRTTMKKEGNISPLSRSSSPILSSFKPSTPPLKQHRTMNHNLPGDLSGWCGKMISGVHSIPVKIETVSTFIYYAHDRFSKGKFEDDSPSNRIKCHYIIVHGKIPLSSIPISMLQEKSALESVQVCTPLTKQSFPAFSSFVKGLSKMVAFASMPCNSGYHMDCLLLPISNSALIVRPVSRSISLARTKLEESVSFVSNASKKAPSLSNFKIAMQHAEDSNPRNFFHGNNDFKMEEIVPDKVALDDKVLKKIAHCKELYKSISKGQVKELPENLNDLKCGLYSLEMVKKCIVQLLTTGPADMLQKLLIDILPSYNLALGGNDSILHPSLIEFIKRDLLTRPNQKEILGVVPTELVSAMKFQIVLNLILHRRMDPIPKPTLNLLLRDYFPKLQLSQGFDLNTFVTSVLSPMFAATLPITLKSLYSSLDIDVTPEPTKVRKVKVSKREVAPQVACAAIVPPKLISTKQRINTYHKKTLLGDTRRLRVVADQPRRAPQKKVVVEDSPCKAMDQHVVQETPSKERNVQTKHKTASRIALF